LPIIHVFGASGAGTSSLGSALQQRYKFTQLDTDDYLWLPTNPPFMQKRPTEERLSLMKSDMDRASKAVISGSLCGWGDPLIPLFDLVVRLVVPTEVRVERLEKREYQRFGKRILLGGDMYEEHQRFLQWARKYDDGDISMRSKAMHDEWQKMIPCTQMILDGTLSTHDLMEEIRNAFPLFLPLK
jgi:adenylate kinase family enzyme